MATLRGPLLSLTASGTLGAGLNYASLRGRAYARRNPKPGNPNTPSQNAQRCMYSFLASEWPGLPQAYRDSWLELPAPDHLSAYNRYLSHNLDRWQRFLSPIATLDAPPTPSWPFLLFLNVQGRVRHARIETSKMGGSNIWGAIFFRQYPEYPEPNYNETIAIHPSGYGVPVGDNIHFDQPLPAGVHRFRTRLFGYDGTDWPNLPTAICTVTDV